MSKIFVLDTNILIHNPNAIYTFHEHNVVIPIVVVEELDRLKSFNDERGRNARMAARNIEKLLSTSADLKEGCALPGGGFLTVTLRPSAKMPLGMDPQKNDNQILLTALQVHKDNPDNDVIFVSLDLNARIKSRAIGIPTENFLSDRVHVDELYTGHTESVISEDGIDLFYKNKCMMRQIDGKDNEDFPEMPIANQFYRLTIENESKGKSAFARYDKEKDGLFPLKFLNERPMQLQPLNTAQKYALEILLDENIQLVCLLGKAGTGKTLLALAAGLKKTLNDKIYRKVSVGRPVIPMGKDIGFLPGSKDDKLFNWMRPIFDNLEFLFTQNDESQEHADKNIRVLQERGDLEIEALTYIRGRSLVKDYFIVDEAQNLTPHEVKTIVSRAGKGTKVVLTGDIYQIDNPYLDATSNGLTYCVEKLKGQNLFASIILDQAERSELSELAGHLL